jgi:hypothetical protein
MINRNKIVIPSGGRLFLLEAAFFAGLSGIVLKIRRQSSIPPGKSFQVPFSTPGNRTPKQDAP